MAWSRARQPTSAGDIRATRRAYQPSRDVVVWLIPAPAGRWPGFPPTAIVARVVAIRNSSAMGIGAPVRTASMKDAISARWPLSWPPRALLVVRLRPVQTVAWVKLSSRALLPPEPGVQRLLGEAGVTGR